MYKRKLEFANYTLNFGEEKVLIDYFTDIVMPSFFEMKYKRKLKNGEFFFLDTELIKLEKIEREPILAIRGRIVKNTKLIREQIFSKDSLVSDISELETAPSSSFLLILNNHRLIFSKEVSGGPTLSNFKSMSQKALNLRYEEYINEIYSEKNKKITKKVIKEENPPPLLRVTTLSDKDNLENFIARFSQIDRLNIKLLKTNNEEINNDDFWKSFGEASKNIKSEFAKVEFANSKSGLDDEEVFEQVSSASTLGNSEIIMKGEDTNGDVLKGNQDDFSLTVEIKSPTKEIENLSESKYREFKKLISKGIIKIPKTESRTISKIREIYNGIRNAL